MRRSPRRNGAHSSALRTKRLEGGYYQTEVAEAANLPLTTYCRLEHGDMKNPRIELLMRCAVALGCTVDDLLEASWRQMVAATARHAIKVERDERPRAVPVRRSPKASRLD